jgi:hypothetical protein
VAAVGVNFPRSFLYRIGHDAMEREMTRKPTPWKLDRPYDPDKRADALKRRFSAYLDRNGVRRRSTNAPIWPVWLLVAAVASVVLAFMS